MWVFLSYLMPGLTLGILFLVLGSVIRSSIKAGVADALREKDAPPAAKKLPAPWEWAVVVHAWIFRVGLVVKRFYPPALIIVLVAVGVLLLWVWFTPRPWEIEERL